jgi:hypothetical protein
MRNTSTVGIIGIIVLCAHSASATPQLSLGRANALPGQTVTLDLSLSGATTPCAGVNAKIILPSTVSLVGLEKGGMLNAGAFATDYRSYSGGCTIIAYSGSDTFRGTDGVLLRLRLNVASNTTAGPKTLSFAPSNPPGVNSKYALVVEQ